jgi:hypothetical protein
MITTGGDTQASSAPREKANFATTHWHFKDEIIKPAQGMASSMWQVAGGACILNWVP